MHVQQTSYQVKNLTPELLDQLWAQGAAVRKDDEGTITIFAPVDSHAGIHTLIGQATNPSHAVQNVGPTTPAQVNMQESDQARTTTGAVHPMSPADVAARDSGGELKSGALTHEEIGALSQARVPANSAQQAGAQPLSQEQQNALRQYREYQRTRK